MGGDAAEESTAMGAVRNAVVEAEAGITTWFAFKVAPATFEPSIRPLSKTVDILVEKL